MSTTKPDTHPPLGEDTLEGATAIAMFLYGRSDKRARRKIYHLANTSRFPVFRRGSRICARKSVILRWINEQERRSSAQIFDLSLEVVTRANAENPVAAPYSVSDEVTQRDRG